MGTMRKAFTPFDGVFNKVPDDIERMRNETFSASPKN